MPQIDPIMNEIRTVIAHPQVRLVGEIMTDGLVGTVILVGFFKLIGYDSPLAIIGPRLSLAVIAAWELSGRRGAGRPQRQAQTLTPAAIPSSVAARQACWRRW